MINFADSPKVTFNFRKQDDTSTFFASRDYDEAVPWTDILEDFINFLEGAGYMGVRSRVSVEDSPFLNDYWSGPVHPSKEY